MYTIKKLRNRVAITVALALGMLGCGVAGAAPIVMNFDGIPAPDSVSGYYNGGCSMFFGFADTCDGPNFGVAWKGATVNDFVSNAPSSPNVMSIGFLGFPDHATMDIAAGFGTALSFYYANQTFADVSVYSGLDGTGMLLANADLAQTPFPADPLQCDFVVGCFEPFGLSFSGIAQSVIFNAGITDLIAFDDITLGSMTPGFPVPEPATLGMLAFGLLLVGGFVTLRQRELQG